MVYREYPGLNPEKAQVRRAASLSPPQPKRKTTALTARAAVALVIHVSAEQRFLLARGTRERGGVGSRRSQTQKRAIAAQTAERRRVACPSGGRGSGTGPRMSEARGKWKMHPPKFAFKKIWRFINTCLCWSRFSSLPDAGALFVSVNGCFVPC